MAEQQGSVRLRFKRIFTALGGLSLLFIAVGFGVLAYPSRASAATFTVSNTGNSGAGSLRQALTDVNAVAGSHTINFNIPGAGPHVITPATALPNVGNLNHASHSITIDGCTQPGAVCGPGNFQPQIRINGSNTTASGQIFAVVATNGAATIKGLSLTNAPGAAIRGMRTPINSAFWLPNDMTIEYNYIGLAPDGTAAGNLNGVAFANTGNTQGGHRNRVAHNVISGNTGTALVTNVIVGFGLYPTATDVVIENNIVGLDPTATQPRPNGAGGMSIVALGSNSVVRHNLLAHNAGYGLTVRRNNPGLLIQQNTIRGNAAEGIDFRPGSGTNSQFAGPVTVHGNTITGNGTHGITTTNASNIIIGGIGPGQGNTIAGNTQKGVVVGSGLTDTSSKVTVRGNSIYGNGGLPVDLAGDEATPNDDGDADSGPNSLINSPAIAQLQHGSLIVSGSYASALNQTYTIDFYISETNDPTAPDASAQTWVGATTVATDSNGSAAFNSSFNVDVPAGWSVMAMATNANGDTSEMSEALLMPLRQNESGSPSPNPTSTQAQTETLAPTGANMLFLLAIAAMMASIGAAVLLCFKHSKDFPKVDR